MLSIGKLKAAQAKYYLDQAEGRVDVVDSVAEGREDYYLGAREARGEWLSAGAHELGLSGGVASGELRSVLAGLDPRDGSPLRSPASSVRVAAFDLTFSAPKSVSVLFGVGDDRVRRETREAHDRAVKEALGYLERSAAAVRRGSAGAIVEEIPGLIAAGFRHRTSRAGDPQLHTHVLVANLGRGQDGRWSALDGRRLYAHARAASLLYQAVLRSELTATLGVEWTPVRDGIAEIDGIPKRVLRAFSRRRAEIEASLHERGTDGARAAEAAALATRRAKDRNVDPGSLTAEWRERAASLGLSSARIGGLVGRTTLRELDNLTLASLFDQLTGASGLTAKRSTFTRRDVIEALCQHLLSQSRVDAHAVERVADAVVASDAVVPLVGERDADEVGTTFRRRDGRAMPASTHERRYSTREFLALEQQFIAKAAAATFIAVGVGDAENFELALRSRPTLSGEQAEMVRALTTDGSAISVVLGCAGAGKTFALSACHEVWARTGYPVVGAAVARHAAQQLEAEAGIPSTSIAALLAGLARGERLPQRAVLVIDEAGMAGTRQLATLLEHVDAVGGKLVLVGDERQLAAIDAGGAFAALVRRGLAVELTENRRQCHAWEREAVEHLRAGRGQQAVDAYRAHGRLTLAPDDETARERLVADWWAAGNPAGTIMLALRRADVADLNDRARERMRTAGALGPNELELRDGGFAAGDHVLIRLNHAALGVSNGQRGVIATVDLERQALELDVDGNRVTLDGGFLQATTPHGNPALAHGYAITGHAAQGTTVDRAFVLADPGLTQEWGYTALTRGRDANHLYVAATRSQWRDEFAPSDPEPPDPIARLARSLSTSRAQTLAIDAARSALGDARIALSTIKAEQHAAALAQQAAQRRREDLERRATRWRPRLCRELEAARDDVAALHERLDSVQRRREAQERQVARLEDAARAPHPLSGDPQARRLQQRLERGATRNASRRLER